MQKTFSRGMSGASSVQFIQAVGLNQSAGKVFMYLPVLIGFTASAFTLASIIWIGFMVGNDILYPAFIFRVLIISWFSGLAFYGWSGFAMKAYYRSIGIKYVERLEEAVVETSEIPITELKRLVSNEDIRQMEPEPEK